MLYQDNISWAIDSAIWAFKEDDFGDEQVDEILNVGQLAVLRESFTLAKEPDHTMPLIASK